MSKNAFDLPHDHDSGGLRPLALKLLLPDDESSDGHLPERVTLIFVSEQRLNPDSVAGTLRQAYVNHRHVRATTPASVPTLSERMQRWSWRMAVHGARAAEARALHTAQTEIWLNDVEGMHCPVLCQVFSPESGRVDEMLNAASSLNWAATDWLGEAA